MKFSEIPYARPDVESIKTQMAELTASLKAEKDYPAAKALFLKFEQLCDDIATAECLAHIRHTIDTRDTFYDEEMKFWNEVSPQLQEYSQAWTQALLECPFREAFSADFGSIIFLNAEIALKSFSPEIIPELQQENELTQAYEKLLASAQIPFEDGVYTLSQLTPFKKDANDARRLAAWQAEGAWYKENQSQLDDIYHKLTGLRDAMGRKLGYDDFTQLGYYRMGRNCYTKEMVEEFRSAVRTYLVPVAAKIYQQQAQRLGVSYPMSFSDMALLFRSGNPAPQGTAEDILQQGKKFYDELSPETSEFFRMMLDNELLDVLSTEGKAGGGYCTCLRNYGVPFIFANFNGTQGDVEVVTHEAGHAFANWLNKDRIPGETMLPGMEACEVHSMSMEFFAWPWADGFFGEDARKFRYSHLAGAITFIPYGAMVDHFQHIVYERPKMTPAQRHEVWRELCGQYMPWVRLDGEIPFYSDGEHWQRQHHIYSVPFYYIDYCLAQTVALQFWALLQQDQKIAWDKYMAYTKRGGSMVFTDLLKEADLISPFDPDCLRTVCRVADEWLDTCDLSGIL